MKKQIKKSMIFYFLFSIFSHLKIEAQIIYTDLIPDVTSANYYLDLNNDGINDFQISKSGSSVTTCTSHYDSSVCIIALNSNKILEGLGYPYYISKLSLNSIIGSNSTLWGSNGIIKKISWNWGSRGGGQSCLPHGYGNWNSSADGYVGLKLIVGTNSIYGWARLSITPSGIMASTVNFTLKDYAYNSIPNQPILAGETSCTIPTVTLSASGPLSFCNGDSVVLTANTTAYKFQWKKDGVNIAGAISQTYAAKTAGVYKCKVTNSCGNKTSGGKTVTVPCRNSNETFVETLEHLSIYPNPATNSVTIKFPSDEAGEILIVNLFGQIVFSEKINSEQNANLPAGRQVDVSKFPAGMYVVRWNSGIINETKTFSVTK